MLACALKVLRQKVPDVARAFKFGHNAQNMLASDAMQARVSNLRIASFGAARIEAADCRDVTEKVAMALAVAVEGEFLLSQPVRDFLRFRLVLFQVRGGKH